MMISVKDIYTKLPVAALCFLCTSVIANCQEVSIAPFVALEYGALLSIRRAPGTINQFPSDGKGSSYNSQVAIGSEVSHYNIISSQIDAVLRFGLTLSSGKFESDQYASRGMIGNRIMTIVETTNNFEVQTQEALVSIDLGLAYRPLHNYNSLRCIISAWAKQRLISSSLIVERIITPNGAFFAENHSAEKILGSGQGIESFPLRFGLGAGVGHNFNVADFLEVRPRAVVKWDVEALLQGLGKRSLSFELAMTMNIGSDKSEPMYPFNVERGTFDTAGLEFTYSTINANVRFLVSDSLMVGDTAVVMSRRTVNHKFTMIPNFVCFEPGSPDLLNNTPDTGIAKGILGNEVENRFNMASTQVLENIGHRLRNDSILHIQLYPIVQSENSFELFMDRVANVRDYLLCKWGVDAQRIGIIADNIDLVADLSCRECDGIGVAASSPIVLAPLVENWIVEDYILPDIGISRKIDAPDGVRNWNLVVSCNNRILAQFSSAGNGGGEALAGIPMQRLKLDSSAIPIKAELQAVDHAGRTVAAYDELWFKLSNMAPKATYERRIYLLLPFNSTPDIYRPVEQALMRDMISAINHRARISIYEAKERHCNNYNSSGVHLLAERILSELNNAKIYPEEIRIINDAPVETDASSYLGGANQLPGFDGYVQVIVEQPSAF